MKDKFPDPLKVNVKPEGLEYDKRSSVFVNMGSHYGVGRISPVGHDGDAKPEAVTLPRGSKHIEIDG